MKQFTTRACGAFVISVLVGLSGCGETAPDESPPPPPVSILAVTARPLQQSTELTGRVSAFRVAEIRAQVGGIVLRRLFEQGTEVRAGQPLFQINPAPFQADADTAAATLQRAEAVLERATTQVERLKPLVDTEAISRQAYDDAVSQRAQAAAEVTQARAELARRRLDLSFARIDAPIGGRIDQAHISEGALVGPADGTPLARIQQIDKVYVDVRQPASALEPLHMAVSSARRAGSGVEVDILRSDGEPFNLKGEMLFSGISVDEGTGDVLVRLLVHNPGRRLLPGMFVRARLVLANLPQAISVPQQAVSRSGTEAHVWTLDDTNRAHKVQVELGERVDQRYVVRSGLKVGDKVVVEGLDRMTDDVVVTPSEWHGRLQARSASNDTQAQSPAANKN